MELELLFSCKNYYYLSSLNPFYRNHRKSMIGSFKFLANSKRYGENIV